MKSAPMASRPRILALAGILAVGVLTGCGDDDDNTNANTRTEQQAAEPPHFSYSGGTGPARWGEIDPSYAECSAGKSQSPIDLTNGQPSSEPTLEVSYEPAAIELENNGHSVQGDYPAGSSITLAGTEYDLVQFHFHSPAEHEIGGRAFPLEFHFVNEAEDGTHAVLGVMATEGAENPAFSELVAALPPKEGETAEVDGEVNAADLLPPDPTSAPRWSYEGSLTTPPCTEGVKWTVFDQPIELSTDQIATHMAVFDGNNRPLQPLNGRGVLLVEEP
jgi:carbonic anhydrase